MKKIILGALIAVLITPSASFAFTPIDTSSIDVSQYTTTESLEELRIMLMKQIIVLLQQRIQELIALRDGTTPTPSVLGIATSTATTEEETETRRRGGGGGGSSNSSSNQAATEQAEIDNLQQTIAELLAELGQMEAEQTTIEELQSLIASLESSLAERDAAAIDYQNQIDELNEDIATLQGDSLAISARVGELETLNTSLQQVITERDSEAALLAASITDLEQQLATNNATILELQTTISGLENDISALEATILSQTESTNTTIAQQGVVISELQGQITNLETQLASAIQSNSEAVANLESQITALELQIADLEADVVTLQTTLTQNSIDNQAAQASLQVQIDELSSELVDWQALATAQSETITDLLDAVLSLDEEVTYLESLITTLIEQIASLQAQIDALTAAPALNGIAELATFTLSPADDTEIEIGSNDAVMADVRVEFIDGDALITALEIEFVDSPLNTELWEVFDWFSLWVDGDKVAEVPGDLPSDYLGINENRIRFSDLELLFDENNENSIIVAADVLNTATSTAVGVYELEVRELQYLDGEDVLTTETSFGDIGTGGGVNFEIEEHGDETLNFRLSSNNPDAATLEVDTDGKSDYYTILVFELEAEEGPVFVEDAYILVETPEGVSSDIIDDSELVINGIVHDQDGMQSVDGDDSVQRHFFRLDTELDPNEPIEVEFRVEFEGQDGAYDVPQQVSASIDLDTRSLWEAEGYDDLNPATDYFGTVFGQIHTLMVDGLLIEDVDTSVAVLGENGAIGQFTIEFDVTAFEDDFYFTDNTGTSSITNGIQYRIDGPDAIQSISAVVSSTADEEQNGVFVIQEGNTETVTLEVVIEVTESGAYRLALEDLLFTNNFDGVSNTRSTAITNPTDLRTNFLVVQQSFD